MKKILLVTISLILFVIAISYIVYKYSLKHYGDDLRIDHTVQDVSRLLPTKVLRVENGKEESQIKNIVSKAKKEKVKVSISGKQHSQGGHTYYPDGVVLDMTSYNKILKIDQKKKTILVQSGATWDDIQKALAPYGLAVKVMQSQNIFTVGGSISSNIHGRDIKNESLGKTINWFRLLLPNGEIKKIDRKSEPELFKNVIGGYGMFGVILEVELQVTDEQLYKIVTKNVKVKDFSSYVHKLRNNPKVKMAYARISVAPKTLMNEILVVEYHQTNEKWENHEELKKLKQDEGTFITYELLNLSRKTDFGKDLLWYSQEKYMHTLNGKFISRNNAMRSESDFLLYKNSKTTDTLQEFFIPIDEFPMFVKDMKEFLKKDDINLMNYTIRYVSKDSTSRLNYAKDDMIALVALFNHGKEKNEIKKAKKSIQKMIDITLIHHGTFNLTYYPYAKKQQVRRAYPEFEEFLQQKRNYDPNEVFMNLFYEEYK